MKTHPRNDYVLVRVVQLEEWHGLVMPETSIQGKEFVVEGIGPHVEDLEVGDKVLMTGNMGVTYYPIPNQKDLIITKQENVALRFEEE